jgi:hypothetical protein
LFALERTACGIHGCGGDEGFLSYLSELAR